MNINLYPYRVLIYYDQPELFLAKDKVDTKYICLSVPNKSDYSKYLCVPVSTNRVDSFILGKIDLKSIFTSPEVDKFFLTVDSTETYLICELIDNHIINDSILPSAGFYLPKISEDYEIINKEVNKKENAVIHFSLSDEDDNYSIPAFPLSDLLKDYQILLKYGYKKEISRHSKDKRAVYESPKNYTLRAFDSSLGSFRLHLYIDGNKTLFGETFIDPTLEKLDSIFEDSQSESELIENLQSLRGHTISTLKRFLERIINYKVNLKYKWASPKNSVVSEHLISKSTAEKIHKLLVEKNELTIEQVVFEGVIHKADINGDWRILNEEDNKEYSGFSSVSLEGIVIEKTKYRFFCEEIIEDYRVIDKEQKKYRLINYLEV